ncbi:hypothetical protein P4133_31380 [Pseudomonas aeruginosa]|nr:hypothetical protein [Pseudomonas aeruginosa]
MYARYTLRRSATLVRRRLVFWIVSVLLLGLLAVPWLAQLFY